MKYNNLGGNILSLVASAIIFQVAATRELPAQTPSAGDTGAQFFREKVHPILQANCVKCHGGEKIKAGLVLTHREGLLQGGESGPTIDPVNLQKSLLLDMVSYRDAQHEMPPSGKLPADQIAILEKWLTQGAPYDPALEKKIVAHKKHSNPITQASDWWAYQPVKKSSAFTESPGNPVDAFLAKSLDRNQIRPNPSAARETLIRRAYYDLIGLPPSPEAVRAFVQDTSPDAWPRLIDTLLAKPEYGEKWARHWMDVVRYAESEGFERDSDKPHIWRYRDYLIEAFNTDVPYDQFVTEQIAGDELEPPTLRSLTATGFLRLMQFDDEPADRLQAKYDILADIVQVTGEAFLGMSIGCARCHDHKKDPISQKDYYSFMSFFHGMNDYGPSRNRPFIWLPEDKRIESQQKQTERLAELDRQVEPLAKIVFDWVALNRPKSNLEQHEKVFFDSESPGTHLWRFTQSTPPPDWKSENFAAQGWSNPSPISHDSTVWMRAQFGLDKTFKDSWVEFEHSGDTEVFLNGAPVLSGVTLPPGRHALELGKQTRLHTGMNTLALRTKSQTSLPRVRVLGSKPALESALDVLRKADDQERARLNSEAKVDLLTTIKQKRDAWITEATRVHGTPVSATTETTLSPAPLSIHRRGNPNVPGDPVEPAFPAVLVNANQQASAVIQPIGKRSSGRRTALARWMTDPSNPLLARVAVNRIWQHHFGRGLVPSSNDFGRLGEMPSHPELLDWLASTFISKGWSIKSMHKLVMTSDAYQRSSANSDAAVQKDPENKLLWRYPMRRLTAEELRDSILSVAGILQTKTFGPPVYPPLPKAVLETQSRPGAGWPVQTSLESARRSVYVHVKRSLSVPLLADHDQAATDTPCAMRFVSTVPTQALGMINSDFMNEHAQLFADRMQREGGPTPEKQIEHGLRVALQREPSPAETKLCRDTLERFQSEFNLPPLKALQRIALLMLNLNEFLYLD